MAETTKLDIWKAAQEEGLAEGIRKIAEFFPLDDCVVYRANGERVGNGRDYTLIAVTAKVDFKCKRK